MTLVGGLAPRESRAGEIHKLTEKDNHRRTPLKVKPGDRVHVVLGSQPGTGHSWRLAPDTTALLKPDKDKPRYGERVDEKGSPLRGGQGPGRPGQFEYRLFDLLVPEQPAPRGGSGELKFILTRPRSDRAADTFTVPIEVKA
jgi:hypothetical protein